MSLTRVVKELGELPTLMCQAAKLTGLLKDFVIDLRSPIVIYGDSQGALALAQNPVFHPRSKHIAIQYHFTCELVQHNQTILRYIPTTAMVTDALTKARTAEAPIHNAHRDDRVSARN